MSAEARRNGKVRGRPQKIFAAGPLCQTNDYKFQPLGPTQLLGSSISIFQQSAADFQFHSRPYLSPSKRQTAGSKFLSLMAEVIVWSVGFSRYKRTAASAVVVRLLASVPRPFHSFGHQSGLRANPLRTQRERFMSTAAAYE